MATKDEIGDLDNLAMWLKVNGEQKQTGSTATFIFNVPQVVSYLSRFMTLLPGDVISTGTPPGVALGFDPPQYLKAGDVVELGIEGLGEQRQECVACRAKPRISGSQTKLSLSPRRFRNWRSDRPWARRRGRAPRHI